MTIYGVHVAYWCALPFLVFVAWRVLRRVVRIAVMEVRIQYLVRRKGWTVRHRYRRDSGTCSADGIQHIRTLVPPKEKS